MARMRVVRRSASHSESSQKDSKCSANVCSMTKQKKEDANGISQRHMDPKEYRIATKIYVHGYGAIPVIKGDPKILPIKAQMFVAEKARLLRPRAIYICDGSSLERDYMLRILKQRGVAQELPALTNCCLISTDPRDASAIPIDPIITSESREQTETRQFGSKSLFAKWTSSFIMDVELDERFPAAMAGRTMYVVPFSLGPIGGRHSINGIQLTDSNYVALMTSICTRVSAAVWDCIEDKRFVRCIHSVGVQRPITYKLINNWPCVPELALLAMLPEKQEVWSYGTASESAVLCKNEVSLRLASVIAKKEGWLAEHMAIIAVTAPDKAEYFFGIAGSSASGKTSMAFLQPTIPGWKVEVIGEQVAWIRVGADGRLYASNPHSGFFLHISAFSQTKAVASKGFAKNAIYVNVGRTSQGKPCWGSSNVQGSSSELVNDWRGDPWNTNSGRPIEHVNAAVAVRYEDCSTTIHSQWESVKGVPLSAIIFCSRRSWGIPLIFEAFSWQHGVFQASTVRTDPADFAHAEACEEPIFDPMGMARFLGYCLRDYIEHWLSFNKPTNNLPKIFFVNLFLRGCNNEFEWPGFGDNIRIFEWIIQRVAEKTKDSAISTAIGLIPQQEAFNLQGLNVKWKELTTIPKIFWQNEVKAVRKIYDTILGANIPKVLVEEFKQLEKRLSRA
ncbi:Phosphoenolpyruvate carboxykinase [GTP] [Toxocara canis]|uniref:phosphoenolpyruvate carboxykinase (GTP) n=1 Tax=Toxocara canis TaxID=6265 RepID=A0A0B2VK50_TOXCA|nr:Phosphoenolpyruvate carboxykinase [GTP] [Toxocara canis]